LIEPSELKDFPDLLVTGASGFIGRHFRSRFGGRPFEDQNGVIDLADSARVVAAIAAAQPTAVLHLAAQSSVASSFKDPRETFAVNFLGTLNLLEALTSSGFQGLFLHVSSADIYGAVEEQDLPVIESQIPKPRNPYAVSKVAAENLCYQWGQTHDLSTVVVRPFNQIGPGHDLRFAVPRFAQQVFDIRRGVQPAIITTGDLEITRDFTDVRDSVLALRLLLEHGRNGETYNLCSGVERSLSSILQNLMDLAGIRAQIQLDPARTRPNEQRRMVGSPAKIKEHTGWSPTIPTQTTLHDILNDLEKH
jgi:GDP-4-dehydro-6-deoxy-D-mannose reductase